ncbi:hypothetical protein EZV62_016863 [Acer yangbiense]|uniref:Uncharacterized protein n=1 Tax=Acer yangbiense TaxID=1000413 RepID=A0A5C7HQA9_9ROSI|nr:hypothetical protein EZV62_016863 [Acer yangbiense]
MDQFPADPPPPPLNPVSIIGPQYCAPYPVDLAIVRKLKTELDVYFANKIYEYVSDFKVKGSSLEQSCTVYAGESNTIVAQIKSLSFLLESYKPKDNKAGPLTENEQSDGTLRGLPWPAFLMSWRRRIGKEDESLFFTGCEDAGLQVKHIRSRVFCITL